MIIRPESHARPLASKRGGELRSLRQRLIRRWRIFWLWRGGPTPAGRMASRLAAVGAGRHRHQTALAALTRRGFISPKAEIIDLRPELGHHVYVAERAVLARWSGTGSIALGDCAQIHRDCTLEVAEGGSISIGAQTALQQGCVLFSALAPIVIGPRAQIACYCAFYSYNHGMDATTAMFSQPLTSKGAIVVEEDAWLGVGVKVLSGVIIGRGAVVGAGSVVVRDLPPFAIAAGAPARVIGYRQSRPAAIPSPGPIRSSVATVSAVR